MANVPTKFDKSVVLVPVASPTLTIAGELAMDSVLDKVRVRNSSTTDSLVQETLAATLTNKTMSGASNTFSNVAYASLVLTNSVVNADIASGAAIAYSKLNLTGAIVSADLAGSIDATKIADGSVTSAEFQFINTLTSNAQTQLNGKATTALDNLASTAVNASIIPASDVTINLGSASKRYLNGYIASLLDSSGITSVSPSNRVLADTAGTTALDFGNTTDLRSSKALRLPEIATPSTPASGNGLIYFKTDNNIYALNDGGIETQLGGTIFDSSSDIQNLTITTAVSSNALTVAIKTKAGSDASASDLIKVAMRSSTLTSGSYNERTITAALSIVVSSGSTLGQTSGQPSNIFVYLIDNAGTLELAISHKLFREDTLATTTAEGGAGGADSDSIMYSTTARTSVPFRLIGKIVNTQTTAGTWASVGTQLQITPVVTSKVPTLTKFTSGSGTYNTPAGVTYIKVKMVGGGASGAGGGSAGNNAGTAGGTTTFGTSLLSAGGGATASLAGSTSPGAGGTSSLGSGPVGIALTGGTGGPGGVTAATASILPGGMGGATPFGGAGGGGANATAGQAAAANTGSGGGGGGTNVATSNAGPGGGAGGYVEALIVDPLSSYAYAVGAAGSPGGTAGTSGGAGGTGAAGIIIIEEYYI